MARLAAETRQPPPSDPHVCAGTLLSREQYLHDVEQLGYVDGRLTPGQHDDRRRTSPCGPRPFRRARRKRPPKRSLRRAA